MDALWIPNICVQVWQHVVQIWALCEARSAVFCYRSNATHLKDSGIFVNLAPGLSILGNYWGTVIAPVTASWCPDRLELEVTPFYTGVWWLTKERVGLPSAVVCTISSLGRIHLVWFGEICILVGTPSVWFHTTQKTICIRNHLVKMLELAINPSQEMK